MLRDARSPRRIADFTEYLSELVDGHGLPPSYAETARKNSFVSLGAQDEDGPRVDSIVDYIDDWKDGDGQLLTILGEYGSGKTTTCFHVAQKYAATALLNPTGARIPILIELKHFSQSFSLRTFLADFFSHQKGINMRSYSTFERLNRQGRFVLLLDGFDEMTNYADPATVHKYLDDILSLQQGKAKVLLTCRTSFFKDKTDLEHLRTASDLHTLLHKHKGYRVLYLSSLSDSQVQFYLSCYYGERWTQFFRELQPRSELRSIANRPILLHMIVSTVHSAESLSLVNTTELYERYTDIWIKRDNWRCHLTPSQRNEISKVLAWGASFTRDCRFSGRVDFQRKAYLSPARLGSACATGRRSWAASR